MLDDKETLLLRREIAALTQKMIELRKRVAEFETALKDKHADPACLNAIASNEPCKPDELKRCTICGFIVDTKYSAVLDAKAD